VEMAESQRGLGFFQFWSILKSRKGEASGTIEFLIREQPATGCFALTRHNKEGAHVGAPLPEIVNEQKGGITAAG